MNGNDQVMGIVKSRQLWILLPELEAGQGVKLTRNRVEEAIPPGWSSGKSAALARPMTMWLFSPLDV